MMPEVHLHRRHHGVPTIQYSRVTTSVRVKGRTLPSLATISRGRDALAFQTNSHACNTMETWDQISLKTQTFAFVWPRHLTFTQKCIIIENIEKPYSKYIYDLLLHQPVYR
jgi:hypothetical protein